MKEGWWINFETGRTVALKCRNVDHESAIRNLENQKWLGLSPSVIQDIYRFKTIQDRDSLLIHLMKTAPLMRIRGHGDYVTFEFSSDEEFQPLDAIRRWARKKAGESTVLNIVNFSGGQVRAVSVLPDQLEDAHYLGSGRSDTVGMKTVILSPLTTIGRYPYREMRS